MEPTLAQLLSPLIQAAVGTALCWLAKRYLNVTVTQAQLAVVQNAAAAGAGAAYQRLASTGGSVTNPAQLRDALAVGVQHVLNSAEAPAAITARGIPEQHVADMVSARLGNLLAADPSVTVDPKPPAAAGLCAVPGSLPPFIAAAKPA